MPIFKIFFEASLGDWAGPLPEAREVVNGLPLIVRGPHMTTVDAQGKSIIAWVLIYADTQYASAAPKD